MASQLRPLSMIPRPRIAASFSAVCAEQLLPLLTAVTVPRDTPAASARLFPVMSNRAIAAAKRSRLILNFAPPLMFAYANILYLYYMRKRKFCQACF